ncbi:MAG: arsenite methyltransferase [Ignavibacteria bacterium]|nr:arsenite methyltransferase [Ignavibacteria bacterium]
MEKSNNIKKSIEDKYSQIAKSKNSCGCCCTQTSKDVSFNDQNYSIEEGYIKEADMNLGCGIPTQYADIKEGDTVLDLGAGAGIDAFIVSKLTGESGKVIGLDLTKEMVKKANSNKVRFGIKNVDFLLGEIENIPLESESVDVVISNCVLNLVPDKVKAFSEIMRVLKPGGHFSISDIVTTSKLPSFMNRIVELYTGCIAGAIEKEKYIGIIKNIGFKNIKINREYNIILPSGYLKKYLKNNEIVKFEKSGIKILSINIYSEKIN